ncbi:MAG TPA: Crp/Fnr family transcriptional regulator [Gemmatimonadota bacterium]|nr:Crp/Fnr family transcriptional regulator [Gemmatimonadota bacterium]
MIDPAALDPIASLDEVPSDARRALAERLREVTFARDERLVPLLQTPSRIMFVTDGLAKVVGVSANGTERIVYVFRPGDITGSRLLLDESPGEAFEIVAMTEVRALAIGKADFLAVGERHPEVLMAVTRAFTRRLQDQTARMLAAMSSEVPVRLSQLLLDFVDGTRRRTEEMVPLSYPLTHEAMAQIIGASRPHTSTVLRDLEEHGAVRRKSPKGLLVRPSALLDIAERGSLNEPA